MRTIAMMVGMVIAGATGCESPAEERAEHAEERAEERAEELGVPEHVEEAMEDRAEQRAEAPAPARVQPGVTITAVDIDCPVVPVFFDTSSAQLGEEDRESLQTLASCLQNTSEPETVRVVGMASPPGAEEYNEVLARQRATNVASFLRMNGVEEGRFRITAIGEDGATEGMPELHPQQRAAVALPRDPAGGDQVAGR